MGNFSKSLQKANLLDQMQQRLNHAELAEARSVFMVACYEAMYGELPKDFLTQVQEAIKDDRTATTKGAFYQLVYRSAQMVDQENAIAEAEAAARQDEAPPVTPEEEAALLRMAVAGLVPCHSEGTEPQGDAETPQP